MDIPAQPNTDALDTLVEHAALNLVRQSPCLNFWEDSTSVSLQDWQIPGWLALPKDHRYQTRSLVAALKRGGRSYKSFEITIKPERRHEVDYLVVSASLNDDFEWRDAWQDAWKLAPNQNAHCLSDNGLKLLRWLQGPKFDGKPINRNTLGRRANLRGSYDQIPNYLREIQAKADPCLTFTEGSWQEPIEISFHKTIPQYYSIGPLNPSLALRTTDISHAELNRFQAALYKWIQETSFKSNEETLGIFDIRDRKTLNNCFDDWPTEFSFDYRLQDFFKAVRLIDGIELAYRFGKCFEGWFVVCRLEKGSTWKQVQERLRSMATEIPLYQKYALSQEACALLKWILDLHSDEYLRNLTPPFEDYWQTGIGIEVEWPEENLRAYVELLIEEINEKTEFDLRMQSWRNYGHEKTRIRVKKKLLEIEELVRLIQFQGLQRNKLIPAETVRKTIESLIS